MRKNWLSPLIFAVLLVTVGSVAGYRVGRYGVLVGTPTRNSEASFKLVNFKAPDQYANLDFSHFWEVWSLLQREYLDQEAIKPDAMVNGAIKGLAASVGDPYTAYLPPDDNKRTTEDLQGSFYGIGIQLGYIDSTLAVMAPLKGTPAESKDIQAGDLILRVRDAAANFNEETQGWSLAEAVGHIRGKKDTVVALTLLRPSQENPKPFEVEVARGEIIVPSVEISFPELAGRKIAHLQVSRFGERTNDEWNAAVAKIVAEPGLAGIVLDLRNNPGGVFDEAVSMASEFVSDGTVVTQAGRYTSKSFSASGNARLKNYPLVVLVNQGSASASEIVAGALRDRKNAKLIGQKTFGKGTVQDRHVLSNNAAVHITVARWLLPSGEWIHEDGIPVTIEVSDNPETEVDEVLERGAREL